MPQKTEAFVLAEKDAPFELCQIELDDPLDDELIIKIVACGLCHTDLSVQNGQFPSPFPCLTGHEGAGIVVQVGKQVTRAAPGDAVLLSFAFCDHCKSCKRGKPASCVKMFDYNFGRQRANNSSESATSPVSASKIHGSFFGQSSFGKHALVRESCVVKVPKDSDLATLAPLGCGLQTGAGAVLNVAKPFEGASVCIFGAGAVGMAALFAAASLGHLSTIVMVDVVQERLDLALQLGATKVVHGKNENVVQRLKELTGGDGVDFVIECTGAPPCVTAGWDSLANSGTMVQCGTQGPGKCHSIDIFAAICSCKTYICMSEGDSNPPVFIPQLVELYKNGKFPIDKIAKKFDYTNFDAAVHAMHSGETIKPIVVFS